MILVMFEYLTNLAFVYYAPFYLDVLSVLYIVEFIKFNNMKFIKFNNMKFIKFNNMKFIKFNNI